MQLHAIFVGTPTGLSEKELNIGDVLEIGTAVFAVTSPRMPCFKLGIKMGDPKFAADFMQAHRTGFYFRVTQEGTIRAGDEIRVAERDSYGLTVEEVSRLYDSERRNAVLLAKAAGAPALPEDWRSFFRKRLEKLGD